ncbi:MAG: hypothetical protein ACREJ3_18215, partial [Polyangiaceae bacterium]
MHISHCAARPQIHRSCWVRFGGALILALVLALDSCKTAPGDIPDAAPSPQATAEPAPFATPPLSPAAAVAGPDAGATIEGLRSDQPLAPDTFREGPIRDSGAREPAHDAKELAGYILQAIVHAGEGPAAPRAPEVNVSGIDAAKRRTEERMTIAITPTRARFVLSSGGFVLPQGTELRARSDRYGHILLWPDEAHYRIAEVGSLRALLGERRLDVAPISPATIAGSEEGGRRLNLRTRRVDVSTRAAKAVIELAMVHESGDGGVLVCRFLLDLMSASSSTMPCATDEVPLHAELRWTTRGALVFDATSLTRRADLPAQEMAVPPASLAFTTTPLPASSGEVLLQKSDLLAFRTAPIEPPPTSPRRS